MPELPEVETIRRGLAPTLVGRAIVDFQVIDAPKLLRAAGGLALDDLRGARVEEMWRRGKLLIWTLSSSKSLVFHFKLSGQVVLTRNDEVRFIGGHPIPRPGTPMPTKTTRLILRFDDGSTLFLNDVRKFAWLLLLPTAEVNALIASQRLGPEPFSPDFTPATLARACRRFARTPIKTVLLDQSVVAGIGNIYSDEALFLARIHPLRPAGSLSPAEIDRLFAAIREALTVAIEHCGATIIGDRAVQKGDFPKVHGRAGQPCFDCPGTVARIRVGGRSSYFCPSCQPLPSEARKHR